MTSMRDWRHDIVRLVEIKQRIAEVDTLGLWEYHLPKVAATTEQLDAVESHLGLRLGAEHRNFLGFANGWPSFFQSVDLFGTDDFVDGPRMTVALDMLAAVEPVVLSDAGLTDQRLLPVAATTVDLDLFVVPVTDGVASGPIVWLAGSEIDRFASFDDYVDSMIEYNRRELERLTSSQR